MFWETAFDVVSLGFSIWEVVQNPKDPWAWAGLVGDAIDLLPIVTGVGETTRAIKTANNLAETADNAVDAIKGGNKALDNARMLGKAGEQASDVTKNSKRIDSITMTANYRIPDGLSDFDLIEVKNVMYQGYTNQIKDFHLYSKRYNINFTLYTRANTTISGPLQKLIESGEIIHNYLP
jgi:hypothetical protein